MFGSTLATAVVKLTPLMEGLQTSVRAGNGQSWGLQRRVHVQEAKAGRPQGETDCEKVEFVCNPHSLVKCQLVRSGEPHN